MLRSDSTLGPVLFCGDPHGVFAQIAPAAADVCASAVVLLGDLCPERPTEQELADVLALKTPVWFIPGNHDADTDALWARVWGSDLADRNIHARVVELPDGRRLAGLGGVFRSSVWNPRTRPDGGSIGQEASFVSRVAHAKSTPRQDRWGGNGPHRRHWGTIYPNEVQALSKLRAEILVTHEAPGYHPNGFGVLDELARSLGVGVAFHGHHHDCLDSSADWASQGFRTFGVGLRGVTALWADGSVQVVIPGEPVSNTERRPQPMAG